MFLQWTRQTFPNTCRFDIGTLPTLTIGPQGVCGLFRGLISQQNIILEYYVLVFYSSLLF